MPKYEIFYKNKIIKYFILMYTINKTNKKKSDNLLNFIVGLCGILKLHYNNNNFNKKFIKDKYELNILLNTKSIFGYCA